MTKKIKKRMEKKVKKLLKKYEIEEDAIDWKSILDSSMTEKENLEMLEEYLSKINPNHLELPTMGEISEEDARAMVKYVGEVNKEFESSIQEMKGKTTDVLEKYFSSVRKNTEILVNSKIDGYILKGETAIGKSYAIIQTMARMGLKVEEDYVVLSSHITALELYHFLYRNNGKIIICDDVMSLFKDDIKKGMLLASLWNPTGKRIVEYHTSSNKLKVPPKFEFNGKVVIICNNFPKELESLKSRCLYQNLNFSVKQKKEIILEICKINKIPMEIFDFINLNCDETTQNLNFRLPIKLNEIYKHNPENWEELSLIQIEKDEKMEIMKSLMEKGLSRKEMFEEWREKSGLHSQSRMYDYKNLYEERLGIR